MSFEIGDRVLWPLNRDFGVGTVVADPRVLDDSDPYWVAGKTIPVRFDDYGDYEDDPDPETDDELVYEEDFHWVSPEFLVKVGEDTGVPGAGTDEKAFRSEADTTDFEKAVRRHLDKVAEVLILKNQSYGNSALDPVRIFSKSSRDEQLNVRIDDKLSRIARGGEFESEDTVQDLLGYLILKRIAREGE